jgi:hypothetical protein
MPARDTARRDGYIPPCIPTRAPKPPAGPDWVHEIKQDGYRLQVRRVGDRSACSPAAGTIGATVPRDHGNRSFTLDGEAVVCGPDGVAVFDALHRRGTVTEAMLYAFDLLELDGEDLRGLRWATARGSWRGSYAAERSASCSATPTTTAPRSTGKPARWDLRASCRNG